MPSYVIEFNRRTRTRQIHRFESAREAMSYRLELESRREDRDVEIAALNSPSMESLQRTHSRYFTGEDVSGSLTCAG